MGSDLLRRRECGLRDPRGCRPHHELQHPRQADARPRLPRDPVLCEAILKENTPNLLDTVDPTKLEAETDAIVRIIETIPQSEELAALLARVHGVHSLADMGLDDSFYHKMAFLSPYVRQRLTFMRTLKFYDFYDEVTTP